MKSSLVLESLLRALPAVHGHHAPGSVLYHLLATVARREVETLFAGDAGEPVDYSPFGPLVFPYERMGAVDSLDLMDIDELIMFSFYWANRSRYRKVLDIGANLGLHSILLARCGYAVRCYEPDPLHYVLLTRNLNLNAARSVMPFQMAVSSCDGEMEFVRVVGNTTGSHLAGSKANPYGELQRFPVRTVAFRPLIADTDLLKLDAEGHEKEILSGTCVSDWHQMDGLISVHDRVNAEALFAHFSELGVRMFSQKLNWRGVLTVEDLPLSHHEGTLFVSQKREMPWE